MRVDGTLMGMDEENKKMIPQWRRGHFSMLFDASTQPASVFICDHEKKLFANMATKKKKVRDIDAEVSLSFDCCRRTPYESCPVSLMCFWKSCSVAAVQLCPTRCAEGTPNTSILCSGKCNKDWAADQTH